MFLHIRFDKMLPDDLFEWIRLVFLMPNGCSFFSAMSSRKMKCSVSKIWSNWGPFNSYVDKKSKKKSTIVHSTSPRLLKNLKNESFPNKIFHSSFWSMEATDFKNVIQNKIHWAEFETAEVEVVFEVTKANISKSSSFYDFSL